MSRHPELLIISAPAKNAEAAPGRTHARAWRGTGRCSTPARAGALTLFALLLAGCQHWCKPDRIVHVPIEVPVERTRYVPVDPEYTRPHPIPAGPVRQCLSVAAARRAELDKCNLDKAHIRAIQSGPAQRMDGE